MQNIVYCSLQLTTHFEMERLPRLKDLLQDGCSEPLQLIRQRALTHKLPVPRGVQLTVSRAKLGSKLNQSTKEFLLSGPCMTSYNSLHDPHLHNYHIRRDIRSKLRRENHITKDNEVICSVKHYNIYEDYLRALKLIADRKYDETQRDKMRKFIEFQDQGLIPWDVTLADITEVFLEEGVENRRQLLQAESAHQKNRGKRPKEKSRARKQNDFFTELYMLSWNIDDRSRLMMYERELRHEQNKNRCLREVQYEKDRKKQALLAQRCAKQYRELRKILKIADGSAKDRHSNRDEVFRLVPPGGSRHLLCSRRILEPRTPRSDRPVTSDQKTTSVETKQVVQDLETGTWSMDGSDDSLGMHDSTEQAEHSNTDEILREGPLDDHKRRSRRRHRHLPPLHSRQKGEEAEQKCAIL